MKPILIIKAGSTLDSLKSDSGDFEDWIVSGTQKPRRAFIVTPVYQNTPLPQPHYISGIIISGSHDNVTESLPWIEKTAAYLRLAAQHALPMLGICFGHQLLAEAFGGRVDFHPDGWELGSVRVQQTPSAQSDPLFHVLPSEFPAFASHSQSVTKLPPDAERLAFNPFEAHHAFRLKQSIWGVQFHPEFNCRIMRAYLFHHQNELKKQRKSWQEEAASCKDTQWGSALLKQFVTIIEKR